MKAEATTRTILTCYMLSRLPAPQLKLCSCAARHCRSAAEWSPAAAGSAAADCSAAAGPAEAAADTPAQHSGLRNDHTTRECRQKLPGLCLHSVCCFRNHIRRSGSALGAPPMCKFTRGHSALQGPMVVVQHHILDTN